MNPQTKIIDRLSFMLSMLESGFTFQESLRRLGTENVTVSRAIAAEWIQIRDDIQSGGSTAIASLKTFIEQLRLSDELSNLRSKVIALPTLQALISCGIFLVCAVARVLQFGFRIYWSDLISMGLLVLGWAAFIFIRSLMTKDLWLTEWIQTLSLLESRMQSGKTLQQALAEVRAGYRDRPRSRQWRALMHESPRPRKVSELYSSAEESWKLIEEGASRAIPILPLFASCRKNLLFSLKNSCEERGTRLAFLFLLPLYLFFLPACLSIILSPLLHSLFP